MFFVDAASFAVDEKEILKGSTNELFMGKILKTLHLSQLSYNASK